MPVPANQGREPYHQLDRLLIEGEGARQLTQVASSSRIFLYGCALGARNDVIGREAAQSVPMGVTATWLPSYYSCTQTSTSVG